MTRVYVSRYLDRPQGEVIRSLAGVPPDLGPRHLTVGPPARLHAGLAVLPVSWRQAGGDEAGGHLRVLCVASGNRPVTEVLLVGPDQDADVDGGALLDEVLAVAVSPAHGRTRAA